MKLTPTQAAAILTQCGAIGYSFHALPSSTVDALLVEADKAGYRKPKNANGSRARYFHAHLMRRAESLAHIARERVAGVKAAGSSCTVTYRRRYPRGGSYSVTASTDDG